MDCGSCTELIPDDSIFCPECGARQEMSRAGGFTNPGSIGLSGQEVSGGRNFGVVSGEAVRQQRDMTMGGNTNISPEILQQIAMGIQQQPNIPPGQFPPQNIPPHQQGQFPPPNFPPTQMGNIPPQGMPQQIPPQGMPQQIPPQHLPQQPPQQGNVLPNVQSDRPQQARGPSLASGAVPQKPVSNISAYTPGGTVVASNPSTSPTDAMVNRLAEAERAMKDERRSQWLNINQTPANNVLASIGTELPSHLRGMEPTPSPSEAPNEPLLRRMCEVAVRRVARKRGVAVETPQAKVEENVLKVNVTYVDDGRVLDTPEALTQAFQHAIQTEVALKGFDLETELKLSRSKDGEVENLNEDDSEDDGVEMFACEICDGLVKETDNECPHCGAMFEEEEEEVVEVPKRSAPKRSGPPGPSKGGPPKKSGPPGPSKGGPPKKSGPPGPSKGGPSGPSKGGPPKKSGPPGPSKGGPSGPSKGGPPKKSGPPGPSKGGPSGPSKGGPPKKSGPPGPSKSGPPKGGPSGPKRGPPR
jgi:RNA polymerase subunit RPABC4/transcription elongation factor Spt4